MNDEKSVAMLEKAMADGHRVALAAATGLSVSALEKCRREKRLPRNELVRAALRAALKELTR